MKMIVLNGPPRSGKDTFLRIMKAVFMDDLPTDTLIPFSFKNVLYMGVGKRYNIDPEHVYRLNANPKTKDLPDALFKGKSVRQCLIYESEEVIKKEFGENGVAIQTFQDIEMDNLLSSRTSLDKCVLITADGGFESEMNCAMEFFRLKREDILLVQFHRNGCTFEGDSRSYIPNPDLIIHNNADKIALTLYLRRIEEFMSGMDTELNGGELDTLYQLVMNGPLESGDMPSKSGFNLLCKRGLARRDSDTWLGYVTCEGLSKFKSLEWRGKIGSTILSLTQAYSCQQDPNELKESRGTIELHDVKGNQHSISK